MTKTTKKPIKAQKTTLKQNLIGKLEKELDLYSGQKRSDEYKNIRKTIDSVKKTDCSSLEKKADKFDGAKCWLNLWRSPTTGESRIYLNVEYKNGYKPNFKDRYVSFK